MNTRKLRLLTFGLLLLGAIGLQSCSDDDKTISAAKLPETARSFVAQHFPDQSPVRITEDKDHGQKNYEVILANGTEIDFNSAGDWTHVDCQFAIVPAAIIPQAIRDDMATRYPGTTVNEIEKELGGYQLGISSGLDLYYSVDGTFIRQETDR